MAKLTEQQIQQIKDEIFAKHFSYDDANENSISQMFEALGHNIVDSIGDAIKMYDNIK